jgi:hypothetical protein
MYPQTFDVSITTSTAGTATGYAPVAHGRVLSLQYGSTTLSSTGSIAYSNEVTGQVFLTKAPAASTPTYYPRPSVCTSTGGTVKYSTGSATVDYFYVAGHRVKIAATGCGSEKSATFRVTVG